MLKTTAFKYQINIQGNETDAKAAQKLKKGDKLLLKRIYDEFDTYEIVICTAEEKELDMLSYPESVGIAPFLDDERLFAKSMTVDNVTVTAGKKHSEDNTKVDFTIEFEYDDEVLAPFGGSYNETMGFMPADDDVFCLCMYRILDYNMPIITQTHLNRYEFEVDIDDDTKMFFDLDESENSRFYQAEILFDEKFENCRIKARIYDEEGFNQPLDFDENGAKTLLTFINHFRIFNGEESIKDCSVDF